MAEFTKDRYGVDVMKVEVPVNMKFVEAPRRRGRPGRYSRDEAKKWFLESAKVATKPFIYLSAGVSNAEFTESLGAALGIRRALLRRPLRPRHVEGRHSRLRQGGRRGVPRWLKRRALRTSATSMPAIASAQPWFGFMARRKPTNSSESLKKLSVHTEARRRTETPIILWRDRVTRALPKMIPCLRSPP
jgi:hypothetical protein